MPDGLEHTRPGRNADTGSNKDRNLVIEYVFSRRAIWAIDPDFREFLAVLHRNFIHSHWVETSFLRIIRRYTKKRCELPRKIADLADVHRDVWIRGTGRDGEGVPLVFRHGRDLDKKPLPGAILHARFLELNLHGIVGMADDTGDLSGLP